MLSLAPAMCLSARAKVLAQHLLNTPLNRLPSFLQSYIPFLQKLFLGAAAGAGIGGGIYYYLQQRNQPKLQLAIFHVLRTLEKNPHLAELLQDPARFSLEMEVEVLHMVGPHLTEAEGDKVLKELKRKVRNDEDWPCKRVRREEDLNDSESINVQTLSAGHAAAFVPASIVPASIVQLPSTPRASGCLQNNAPPAPCVEDEDDMEIEYQEGAQYTPEHRTSSDDNEETPFTPYVPPAWQKHTRGRGTGKAPSVSSEEDEEMLSSEPPAPPPVLTDNIGFTSPAGGYGFDYNDWSTDEDSSSSSSKSPLPPTKYLPSNKPLPSPILNNLIDSAMESAFNPNSPGNKHLPLSAFARAKACGVKVPSKSVMLPRTSLPRTPPTQSWLHKNRQQILTGTDLSPIEEGDSLVSDKSQSTKYCVAETLKFDMGGEAQRTAEKTGEYQPTQDILDSSATERQIRDLQQEIDVLEQEINDDDQADTDGPATQKSKEFNAALTSSPAVVTPNGNLGQMMIEAAKTGIPSPKTTIGDLIIAAAKSGTPPASQSPKTMGARVDIRASFRLPWAGSCPASDSNLPAPVPSPSKKTARVYVDEQVQAIFGSESVDDDKALQEVLAKQPEADKCTGVGEDQMEDVKSSINFRGPNASGPPPVATSQSPAVEEPAPSSQNCVVVGPVGDEHNPLIVSLSPAVSRASTPPKRGRSRPPKTPVVDKTRKSAGVSKSTLERPLKTPRKASVESVGRRSTRKTSYKGKFTK